MNFHIRPMPVNHKVPLRGTCNVQLLDQTANLSEVLAWSFSLKSVLRTAYIFDVSPDINEKNHHQDKGAPLIWLADRRPASLATSLFLLADTIFFISDINLGEIKCALETCRLPKVLYLCIRLGMAHDSCRP